MQKTDGLQHQPFQPMVGVFTEPSYNVVSGAVKTPTTSWNDLRIAYVTSWNLNYDLGHIELVEA